MRTIETLTGTTTITGTHDEFGGETRYTGDLVLVLLARAWGQGLDLDDLCDGYGLGVGTCGDWSAIRDSSPDSKRRMLERALDYLCFLTDRTLETLGVAA